MKNIITCFLFTIVLSSNNFSQTHDRRDGNWWNNQEYDAKYYYVTGFFDGMDLGFNFSHWGVTDLKKESSCTSRVVDSYINYKSKYFKNVTNVQLCDGLNEFYTDYRNRRIKISSAIWLVSNGIVGTPKEDLEKMIENFRKNSSD